MDALRKAFAQHCSLARPIASASCRQLHLSIIFGSSVFSKKTVKLDPEISKMREQRKRRNLGKQIVQLKRYSLKPKPIEEMRINIFAARNLEERKRDPVELSTEVRAERKAILRDYARSRAKLMIDDDRWLRHAIQRQKIALDLLKRLSPDHLYPEALKPDPELTQSDGLQFVGPALSPPIPGYQSLDGDYLDTTNDFMMEAEINIFEHKEKRLLARRAVNKAKDQKAAAAAGTRTVA